MTYGPCLQGVIDAARGALPPSEIKDFIRKVRNKVEMSDNPAELEKIVADYNQRLKAMAANDRYNARLNAVTKMRTMKEIENASNPHKGLMDKLLNGKTSVRRMQLTYEDQFLGMLQENLKPEELTTLQNANRDIEIAEQALMGQSTDKVIRGITDTLVKAQKAITRQFREAGANIGELTGRLWKQAHNPEALLKITDNPASTVSKKFSFFDKNKRAMTPEEQTELSFQEWNGFTKPRLNRAKSGLANATEQEVDSWMKEFYLNCISSVHRSLESGSPDVFASSGILKRLESQRKMFFNSPKDEVEYARKYGYGSIYENIQENFKKAARDLGLLQNFGTNPENMFEKIKSDLMVKNKANKPLLDKLRGRGLQTAWENVTGHHKMVGDRGFATVMANTRAWEASSKFGGSTLTAITMDPIGRAAFLKNNRGKNWLSALTQAYTESLKYLNVDRATIKNFSHANVVHTLGHIQNRLGMDSMPGKFVSKMQNKIMQLSGLPMLDKARLEGVQLAESNDFGNALLSKQFDQLNSATQATYQAYGFGPAEWNVLKNASFKTDKHGAYIFSDTISKLEDEHLKDYAKSIGMTVSQARNQLAAKMGNYLREASGFMVMDTRDPTMGLIYNYFGGPGTLGGETVRTALLGKAWPVQYFYRVVWPLISQGSWTNRVSNAAVLTVFSTLMMYGDLSLKNFLSGKLPDDPTDWHTWLNALSKSGGLGVVTDLLEYAQNPQSLLPIAANEVYKLLKIPYDAVNAPEGEGAVKARHELFEWTKGNIPGINLWYTKLMLDHAVLNKIQELIDPGAVEKLQYNNEEKGTKYWWSPTQNTPKFMQ